MTYETSIVVPLFSTTDYICKNSNFVTGHHSSTARHFGATDLLVETFQGKTPSGKHRTEKFRLFHFFILFFGDLFETVVRSVCKLVML